MWNQSTGYEMTTNELNPYNLYEVPNPPTDSISELSWCPTKNMISASSWDSSVLIWKIEVAPGGINNNNYQNAFKASPVSKYQHQAPVLCTFFTSQGVILSGGCDNIARAHKLGGNNVSGGSNTMEFGKHQSCVSTVKQCDKINAIMTGGWDKKLYFWDSRFSKQSPIMKHDMPERVYCSGYSGNIFIVGCGGRNKFVGIYDLRKPQKTVMSLKSPLQLMTRCLSVFPNCGGYLIGSVEGRVQINYFNDDKFKKKSFAFKCHREGTGKTKKNCFPVNDLDFNPSNGNFATCGGNGRYHFWNKEEKRRTFHMKKKVSCAITSGRFNQNGQIFAVAIGNDFSQGTETQLFKSGFGSKIFLHPVGLKGGN